MNPNLTITELFNEHTNSKSQAVAQVIAMDMVIHHRRRRLLKIGFDGV